MASEFYVVNVSASRRGAEQAGAVKARRAAEGWAVAAEGASGKRGWW